MYFIKTKYLFFTVAILTSLTFLSGLILSSSSVSADEDTVVDEINITVPVSCNLTGTGMQSHNATINNGTYVSDIGTTTIKAYCNDKDGFAIYAIGYTDDTDGKNVMTSSTLGSTHDIATGTGTSGNSQWAMKLSTQTNPEPTYPVTIQNNYNNYHTVPDDYDLVAKRTSATDIGSSAEGSTLTSTYQIYVSPTQSAGTYVGQVKYVLVHPNNTDEIPVREDQVAVIFDGNGLSFTGGATKNRVVYGETCTSSNGYVGTTPTISKSPNVDNNGDQNGGNSGGTDVYDTVTFTGADRLKVVINYDTNTDGNTWIGYIDEATDSYDNVTGSWISISEMNNDSSLGNITFLVDGDVITFNTYVGDDSNDYGYYAQVYPVYDTEQPNTDYEELPSICNTIAISGAYAEPSLYNGSWYENNVEFFNQDEIIGYIDENKATLLGTTIYIFAYNPYKITYNGNNATAGTMNDFYTTLDSSSNTFALIAPNYYKTNYGFAGWSENPNATVNSNDKIFGPNETITVTNLVFNDSNNSHHTTLYAVWVPSAGNLQNWSGCSSLNRGQVTALTDSRDNNVYAVGKMQDGSCWMMENLRLDAVNSTNSSLAQGFGGLFTGLADSEDANFAYFYDSSSPANSRYDLSGSYSAYRFPRYNNNNTNIGGTNSAGTTLIVSPGAWNGNDGVGNSNHIQWYGYGNYYTWAAAMANTTNMTSVSASEAVSTSICPTGWSLPYGRNTGNGATSRGFSYLDIQMGGTGYIQNDNEGEEVVSNRWRSYPNNFVYSGHWSGSNARSRGRAGDYWSRTADNSSFAYYMSFYNTFVSPGTHKTYQKYYGLPIRCLTQ